MPLKSVNETKIEPIDSNDDTGIKYLLLVEKNACRRNCSNKAKEKIK